MSKGKSAIARGYKLTLQNPGLWLFAFLAFVGGIFNISLMISALATKLVTFSIWFSLRGLFVLPRIFALSIGLALSFFLLILLSSFGRAVITHLAAAKHYDKKDIWFGSFRSALRSSMTNTYTSITFYIVSVVALLAVYEFVIFIVKSIPYSPFAYYFWLILTLLIAILIVSTLGMISIFAYNFASIYKLRYFKSLRSAIDLFFVKPFESFWMLIKISMVGLLCALGAFIFYNIVAFIVFKISISQGLTLLSGHGLIYLVLIGIMYLLLVMFTSFMHSTWTFFFLDNAEGVKFADKKEEFETSRGTVMLGT